MSSVAAGSSSKFIVGYPSGRSYSRGRPSTSQVTPPPWRVDYGSSSGPGPSPPSSQRPRSQARPSESSASPARSLTRSHTYHSPAERPLSGRRQTPQRQTPQRQGSAGSTRHTPLQRPVTHQARLKQLGDGSPPSWWGDTWSTPPRQANNGGLSYGEEADYTYRQNHQHQIRPPSEDYDYLTGHASSSASPPQAQSLHHRYVDNFETNQDHQLQQQQDYHNNSPPPLSSRPGIDHDDADAEAHIRRLQAQLREAHEIFTNEIDRPEDDSPSPQKQRNASTKAASSKNSRTSSENSGRGASSGGPRLAQKTTVASRLRAAKLSAQKDKKSIQGGAPRTAFGRGTTATKPKQTRTTTTTTTTTASRKESSVSRRETSMQAASEINEISAALASTKREYSKVQKELQTVEEKTKTVQDALRKAKKRQDSIIDELQQTKDMVEHNRRELEDQQRLCDDSMQELDELKSEHKKLQAAIAKQKKANGALKSELSSLKPTHRGGHGSEEEHSMDTYLAGMQQATTKRKNTSYKSSRQQHFREWQEEEDDDHDHDDDDDDDVEDEERYYGGYRVGGYHDHNNDRVEDSTHGIHQLGGDDYDNREDYQDQQESWSPPPPLQSRNADTGKERGKQASAWNNDFNNSDVDSLENERSGAATTKAQKKKQLAFTVDFDDYPVGGGGVSFMGSGSRPVSSANHMESPSISPSRVSSGSGRNAMGQCSNCGRNFLIARLDKHESICKRTSSKPRKVFDPTKARVQGTDAEKFLRKSKANEKKYEAAAKRKSNWRAKSEAFRAAMRAGRDKNAPPPPSLEEADYVPCPSCGRTFSQTAAERHIPRCQQSKSIRNPRRT